MEDEKIFVTGGFGFIESHTVFALQNEVLGCYNRKSFKFFTRSLGWYWEYYQ